MSGTNKSEKIRDSTRRLTTTSQQQKNSSCCPWGRRGSRGLKKGPSGATGCSQAPSGRQPCCRDCATTSGTAWEAAAGTQTGRDGPLQPPRAGHPTTKSSRTSARRRGVGRQTIPYLYAERFEANVRLTMTAGRQFWDFRGNGEPSHRQPASPQSRCRGKMGWCISHVVGPLPPSR